MDLADLLLLIAVASAFPAALVLVAVLVEHRRTGPFMRRHSRKFIGAAAAFAAASLLLRLQDPANANWLGVATSVVWLVTMLGLLITQPPPERHR